jgi:NAD(P)-dependent dehydrogenase (short-subunit alcohol dehydrogenase family)
MPTIERSGLSYTGRVVVVTGGSKGIGEGCARVFVDAGSHVVICARGAEKGRALASELNDRGPGTCHFEPCDVSQPEEACRVIDAAVSRHGGIDCLINNAGYHPPFRSIDECTAEELHALLNINLVAYVVAAQRALPHLRRSRGSVINMGSLVALIGEEGAALYCASKGAISSFSKALAIEEARYGVRVNCVLPGNIHSDSRRRGVASSPDPAAMERTLDSHQVVGRSGTPEEVGQLCLFLASDAASYITGTDVIISGGSEIGYGVKWPPTLLPVPGSA